MELDNYKIYWNNIKNVPMIINEEKDTLLIKNKELIYLTTDLRPVFLEEKHLIKNLFALDGSIYYKSVWCNKQGRYSINGKQIKNSVVQAMKNIINIDEFRNEILDFQKTQEMINSENKILEIFVEENRERMHYLLESKDKDSEEHYIGAYPFIDEVIQKYKNRVPMISFSGGKDSTVVSHLVRKGINSQSVLHIFGDTTLELPLTYQYIKEFKENNPAIPFFEERNDENDFLEMCKKIGPPSRVKSWCCSIFKTGPMGTTLSNFDRDFLTFYGIRRKESQLRSKYHKVSKTPKIHGGIVNSPIIDWLDLEVWMYIISEKLEFNFSYRQGFPRVGCWMCPNNSDLSQLLARIHVHKSNCNSIKFDSEDWEKFIYEFSVKIVKNYHYVNKISISKDKLDKKIKYYVENNKWKARQGGDGVESSKNTIITKKECIDEKNTYNLSLNRPIDDEFATLFKPFGKISFRNQGISQEMLLINKNGDAIIKIIFKNGEEEIRVTIIDLKDRYLYGKIIRQLNKFNCCIYCQACNSTCNFGALSVVNGNYTIDENKCVHCLNCVNRFEAGCLVASTLKIKTKE